MKLVAPKNPAKSGDGARNGHLEFKETRELLPKKM